MGAIRLTIFWRVILAQSASIALILVVSFSAMAQLHQFIQLNTDIQHTEAVRIELGESLFTAFLTVMQYGEQYILLQDHVSYSHFTQGQRNFVSTIEKLATVLDTPYERGLLERMRGLQARYTAELTMALKRQLAWSEERAALRGQLIACMHDLLRSHGGTLAHRTSLARDQMESMAGILRWLSVGGITLAVVFAYCHSYGFRRPLHALTQALRRVGQGEFPPALSIRAPKEISELTQTFNGMSTSLAELDKMKTDFMAHISHELRTPMTGIQEGTALLLEQVPGPLTPNQRRILDIIQNHCERLWHYIVSMLDLSKMEAGMMAYMQVPSELTALMARSMDTVRLLAHKKQLQLEVLCPVPLPALCLDAGRIQQVLDNLLSNAVKFTPPGGRISVSAGLREDGAGEGQWVEVQVSDTGVGIAAEEAERIFDRFYQSPSHRGSRQAGTGLGLAIARHIVEAHGGRIWVESHPGQGATFAFTLPVGDPAGRERY